MSESNESMKDRMSASEKWTAAPFQPGSRDQAEGVNRLIAEDPADDANPRVSQEEPDEEDIAEKVTEGGVAASVDTATTEFNLTPRGI